jgi:hypothetical protein
MRKIALILAATGVLLLVAAWYPARVEKPVKDGSGSLSVYVDPSLPAPEYHSPLEWWRTHHADVLARGDLLEADCLQCHTVEKSCNNCHSYVGAAAIIP